MGGGLCKNRMAKSAQFGKLKSALRWGGGSLCKICIHPESQICKIVLADKSLRSEEFPTQVRGELSARIGGGELSAIFPFRKSLRTDFTFWTLCSDFNQLFKCLIQECFYLHILSCVWFWTRLLAYILVNYSNVSYRDSFIYIFYLVFDIELDFCHKF